jgi:hypothetical protein
MVLILFLLPSLFGCTQYRLWQLERELDAKASPEIHYVAARLDYNAAKRAAAKYSELATTSRAHVEKILAVVVDTDQVIADVEEVRKAGAITGDKYRAAAAAIRAARVLLAAYIQEEVAQ